MRLFAAIAATCLGSTAAELDPSKQGRLLFEDGFEGAKLASGWKAPKGKWEMSNGAVKGAELPADKHAAVIRHPVKYTDAVIQLKFRFDGARQASLSLNGAGGHICRVILRPDGFVVQKDKTNAKSTDKAAVLAKQETPIAAGKWHELVVRIKGGKMMARVDGGPEAGGEHSGIAVEKTDVGLPVSGESAWFDSIRVWEAR